MTWQFTRVRPDQLERQLSALGVKVQKPNVRFLKWVYGRTIPGDRLKDEERTWLVDFLDRNGFESVDLNDVTTVQFTERQCACDLEMDKHQVSRCKKWAKDNRVLIEVSAGIKGHGSLFALAPIVPGMPTKTVQNVGETLQDESRSPPTKRTQNVGEYAR